jgi:hypothetical protein
MSDASVRIADGFKEECTLCRTMGMGKSALSLMVLLTSVPVSAARAETMKTS